MLSVSSVATVNSSASIRRGGTNPSSSNSKNAKKNRESTALLGEPKEPIVPAEPEPEFDKYFFFYKEDQKDNQEYLKQFAKERQEEAFKQITETAEEMTELRVISKNLNCLLNEIEPLDPLTLLLSKEDKNDVAKIFEYIRRVCLLQILWRKWLY